MPILGNNHQAGNVDPEFQLPKAGKIPQNLLPEQYTASELLFALFSNWVTEYNGFSEISAKS